MGKLSKTDPHWHPPKPEPLPGADQVQTLLDNGENEKARRCGKAFTSEWFKKAEAGKIMNLSDMLAVNELLIEEHHNRNSLA